MRKAERTRQFIIEKTAPLFNKKGFHGTSLLDITDATGLTKGSVYGNFKNKDELAIEAFRHNYFHLTQKIRENVNAAQSAIEKLLAFTQFYKNNYLAVFERGGCAILNTGTDADDNHPLLKEEVKTSLVNWKKLLVKILNDGIQSGELKDINPGEFIYYFIALIEGSIFLAKTTGDISALLRNTERLEREILALKK